MHLIQNSNDTEHIHIFIYQTEKGYWQELFGQMAKISHPEKQNWLPLLVVTQKVAIF